MDGPRCRIGRYGRRVQTETRRLDLRPGTETGERREFLSAASPADAPSSMGTPMFTLSTASGL